MTLTMLDQWGDMRTWCDEALKLVGMLPSATKEDPDFLENVIADLSSRLCCLDTTIGETKPEALSESVNAPATGTGKDDETRQHDESFPRAYVIKRDSEIASWLTELTELVSELLADDAQIHHDQIKYLHERLWKMRWHFGFAVEPTQDGES